MTALNSEERPHLRLPTSTSAAIASGTTSASFLTTTLQFTTPASSFTSPPSDIRAGTSGNYEEGTPPQQGSSQDGGVYAANATTIACLPSTGQPPSSTIYTHSDPLSGLSWSFEAPPLPVSSGQLIFFYKIPKFTTAVTLLFICRFSNQSFL